MTRESNFREATHRHSSKGKRVLVTGGNSGTWAARLSAHGRLHFLASDLASYVTATTAFVDGGMTDYPSFAHGG